VASSRIYSVWDPSSRQYTYYRGPGPEGTHAGSPTARRVTDLGAAPEDAAWKLPGSAVKIGVGPLPKGRIAAPSSGMLSGLGLDTDPTSLALYAALGYLAWRMWK